MPIKIFTATIFGATSDQNQERIVMELTKKVNDFVKTDDANLQWLQSSAANVSTCYTQLTVIVTY